MSSTNKRKPVPAVKATPADLAVSAPVETAPAGGVDERDDEIARLEARLAELTAPPPPPDPKEARLAELRAAVEAAEADKEPAREMDARDRTIAELRRQLSEINSTPEGAHAELVKAFAALQQQVTAMQNGAGKIAVPVNEEPDPYIYGVSFSCGCVGLAQHPHATHTFCTERDGSPRHGSVEVKGYWRLADGEQPVDTHAELVGMREELAGLRREMASAKAAGDAEA